MKTLIATLLVAGGLGMIILAFALDFQYHSASQEGWEMGLAIMFVGIATFLSHPLTSKTPLGEIIPSLVVVGVGLIILASILFFQRRFTLQEIGIVFGILLTATGVIWAFCSKITSGDNSEKPTWADVGMLIITTAGFGLTIWSIYYAAEAFQGANYSTANQSILDLDKEFVEHPELRPYFYQDGTNLPLCIYSGGSNDVQVMAMCEYVLDTFDSYLEQRLEYGHQTIGREMSEDWTNYMMDVFSNSPSSVIYMNEHQKWYHSGLLYSNVYLEWVRQNPDTAKGYFEKARRNKASPTVSTRGKVSGVQNQNEKQ